METSDWKYDADINPTDYEGFVYLITNVKTGQMYVGQKSVWTYKKGKRDVESKWRSYWGSSKLLLSVIAEIGKDQFTREVLHWCSTKGELSLVETTEQFKRDVLTALLPNGERLYYNQNILRRFFSKDGSHNKPHTEEAKAKMRSSWISHPRQLVHTEEAKAKISAVQKGRKRTDEQKANHSRKMKGRKGTPHSIEVRQVISEKAQSRWSNPEFREKASKAISAAYKAKGSEISKKRADVIQAEQANEIKDLLDNGVSMAKIARDLGISLNPIKKIKDGTHWTQRSSQT